MAVERIKTIAKMLPGVTELEPFVIHQGFLEKKGNQSITAKDWQPRWCVMTQVGLYYFRQRASTAAAGQILFTPATEVSIGQTADRPFVFQLKAPSGRVFYFQALDGNELQLWLNLLTETCRQACKSQASAAEAQKLLIQNIESGVTSISSSSSTSTTTSTSTSTSTTSTSTTSTLPSSSTSPSTSNHDLNDPISDDTSSPSPLVHTRPPSPPPSSALKAGWLRKQGGQVRSWKRRWFVLSDSSLCYQRQPSDGEPLGRINMMLSAVKVPQDPASLRKFSFEVVTSNRTYFIQADSAQSLDEWVSALRACISDSIASRKTIALAGGTPNVAKQHLLNVVCRLPGNTLCADCAAPSPTWASINLGVLLCIDCAGIHRSLGVSISQVRSCQLDTCWDIDTVAWMEGVGNARYNRVFCAKFPAIAEALPPNRDEAIPLKYSQAIIDEMVASLHIQSRPASTVSSPDSFSSSPLPDQSPPATIPPSSNPPRLPPPLPSRSPFSASTGTLPPTFPSSTSTTSSTSISSPSTSPSIPSSTASIATKKNPTSPRQFPASPPPRMPLKPSDASMPSFQSPSSPAFDPNQPRNYFAMQAGSPPPAKRASGRHDPALRSLSPPPLRTHADDGASISPPMPSDLYLRHSGRPPPPPPSASVSHGDLPSRAFSPPRRPPNKPLPIPPTMK